MYTQVLFAFQRVKELAPQHPEWKTEQPFKALLEGDMKTVDDSGMKGISKIVMATHAGMTATEFQIKDGKPALVRQPKINFIDDKEGKPVGIYQHIGQRPILAFGNADADMQMIQYTKAGNGRSLGLFLHHTDAEREFAYDRKSHVGALDKVLDMAKENDWIIVDIKRDWKQVFPFEKAK